MSIGESKIMPFVKQWLKANGKSQRWLIEKIKEQGVFVDDALMSNILNQRKHSRKIEEVAMNVIGHEIINKAHSSTHI